MGASRARAGDDVGVVGPLTFLNELLHRPSRERAHILFPIGYPARDAEVPDLNRKTVSDTLVIHPAAPAADPGTP